MVTAKNGTQYLGDVSQDNANIPRDHSASANRIHNEVTSGQKLYSITIKTNLAARLWADNPHRPDAPQKLARVDAGLDLLV